MLRKGGRPVPDARTESGNLPFPLGVFKNMLLRRCLVLGNALPSEAYLRACLNRTSLFVSI